MGYFSRFLAGKLSALSRRRRATLQVIQQALEKAGVHFIREDDHAGAGGAVFERCCAWTEGTAPSFVSMSTAFRRV